MTDPQNHTNATDTITDFISHELFALERYEEALRFYASSGPEALQGDQGERATAALREVEESRQRSVSTEELSEADKARFESMLRAWDAEPISFHPARSERLNPFESSLTAEELARVFWVNFSEWPQDEQGAALGVIAQAQAQQQMPMGEFIMSVDSAIWEIRAQRQSAGEESAQDAT